ncbi:hypothetical protein [Patulibacter minatonensis]|uniref:hypothetical protein n=1 Tax=Patulibacter minatonensis TaxID=298163 RepID=UPI00047B1ED3|nr:hypothetical protein [Patulibacter minatonensis]
MADDPLLPLAPRQLRVLGAAIGSSVAAYRPKAGSDRLPRVPEQVLVALVGELRAELDPQRSSPGRVHAHARVATRAAVPGAFGAPGLIPTEVVGLVEQARAGVAAAVDRAPHRSDAAIAGDLLIAWGLLDDAAQADAIADGSSERSLLDALVVRGGQLLRDAVPERWTPWSTLRLLWRMRQLPGLRQRFSAKGLRSRGLRAIPVLGAVPSAVGSWREMTAFQHRLSTHHRAIGL